MGRSRLWAVLGLFALSACTCAGPTHHARLSDARGLTAGAPVTIAGVTVGSVSAVRVVEADADVSFTLSPEHDITLRETTCAMASVGDEEQAEGATATAESREPRLVLVLGDGAPLREPRTLPECRLDPEDLLSSLGAGLGDLMRSLGVQLQGGSGGGSGASPLPFPIPLPPPMQPTAPPDPSTVPPTTPPTPGLPRPLGGESPCATFAVRVQRVVAVEAVPLHLPHGGARVVLELRNDGERTITTGTVSTASFVTASGEALAPATLPGSEDWLMPIEIPPHAHAEASVTFPRPVEAVAIDTVELRSLATTDDPLGVCVARATGLATR